LPKINTLTYFAAAAMH